MTTYDPERERERERERGGASAGGGEVEGGSFYFPSSIPPPLTYFLSLVSDRA